MKHFVIGLLLVIANDKDLWDETFCKPLSNGQDYKVCYVLINACWYLCNARAYEHLFIKRTW